MKCKCGCTATLSSINFVLRNVISCNIYETVLNPVAFSFEMHIVFWFGFKKWNTVKDVAKLFWEK